MRGVWEKLGEWLRLSAFFNVLVILVVGWAVVSWLVLDHPKDCTAANAAKERTQGLQPQAIAPAQAQAKPSLKLLDGQRTSLAFGRKVEAKSRTVTLAVDAGTLPPGTMGLRVQPEEFSRADDARIAETAIWAETEVTTNDLVRLTLGVDRTCAGAADPGTYAGLVTINDPSVRASTVPFTVTMAYPTWWFVSDLFFGVVLVGIVYTFLIRTQVTEDQQFESIAFGQWLGRPSAWVAIVAGGVAAYGVFNATYLQSVDWGGPGTWATLTLAMFSAFAAAATAAQLIRRPAGQNPAPPVAVRDRPGG